MYIPRARPRPRPCWLNDPPTAQVLLPDSDKMASSLQEIYSPVVEVGAGPQPVSLPLRRRAPALVNTGDSSSRSSSTFNGQSSRESSDSTSKMRQRRLSSYSASDNWRNCLKDMV